MPPRHLKNITPLAEPSFKLRSLSCPRVNAATRTRVQIVISDLWSPEAVQQRCFSHYYCVYWPRPLSPVSVIPGIYDMSGPAIWRR
jgi:hypothetical protein